MMQLRGDKPGEFLAKTCRGWEMLAHVVAVIVTYCSFLSTVTRQ
jgi:hypothetical protein